MVDRHAVPQADVGRRIVAASLVALVLASLVLTQWFNRGFLIPDPTHWEKGQLLTASYDPPTRPVELFMNQGDGQIYAHGAQDPFVRHPERIRGGPSEQAYRLMRPMLGWTAWVASLGRPRLVAPALLWLMLVGAAALTAVACALAARLGREPEWGLLILLAPGMLLNVRLVGPETLGTALLGLGLLALWGRPDQRRWAIVCFALAGLFRESFLAVPLVIALVDAWEARADGARSSLRTAAPLAVSAVPFLTWVLALRGLTGSWPLGSEDGRLSLVPFGGLVAGIGRWGVAEWTSGLLILVPALVALVVARDRRLRVLIGAHLVYAASFGEVVWQTWIGFSRVLLPLSLLTYLVVLVGRRSLPWPTPWRGAAASVGEGQAAAV